MMTGKELFEPLAEQHGPSFFLCRVYFCEIVCLDNE
jgi:hypothetical protein